MEFLPLLFMAVLVRYLWARYLPALSPRGWFFSTLGAYFGALAGGILQRYSLHWGPNLAGFYVVGALLGSVLVLFVWGLGSYLRVLLRGR